MLAALGAGAGEAEASPTVVICFVDHTGACNGQAGWQVEDPKAGVDSCSGSKMFSAKLGYDDAVWIDDTTPNSYRWHGEHGRRAMADCERMNRVVPAYRIFVGCTSGEPCGVTNAINIGEYYPFHWLASCNGYLTCTGSARPSSPSFGYGACPTTVDGKLNGFLTQRLFAWPTDSPPTANEAASEWHYAAECVPPGSTMAMGKY